MIYQTFIYLSFLFIFFSLTMANPCPCELVVNETPIRSTRDSSGHPLSNEESAEDLIDPPVATTDKYQELTNLYPFIRETKSLATTRKRFKRPSWATIGKRSSVLIQKRPSWATIG